MIPILCIWIRKQRNNLATCDSAFEGIGAEVSMVDGKIDHCGAF